MLLPKRMEGAGKRGLSQQVCAALRLRVLPNPVQQHAQPVIRGPSCKCRGRAREAITHASVTAALA